LRKSLIKTNGKSIPIRTGSGTMITEAISRLRVHETQEWYDLYQPSTNDGLQLVFDRYAKGVQNKWEETPKVRVG
jgi:hypothetical protein